MFTIRHTFRAGWEVLRDGVPWSLCYIDEWDDAVGLVSMWHPGAVAPMLAALKCEACGSSRDVLPEAVGTSFLLCCRKCRACPSTATGGSDHAGKVAKKAHVVHELSRPEWIEVTRAEVRRFNLKTTGSRAVDDALRLPEAPKREPYPFRALIAQSDAPTDCSVCGGPLNGAFIDGVIKHAGWGYMDPGCHKSDGIGLGVGRGHLYLRQEDGSYRKADPGERPGGADGL